MTSLPAADLLRLAPPDSTPATSRCLDELELARLADGSADASARSAATSHLAECGRCRTQLAALMALLRDPAIVAEVARVRNPRRPLRSLLLPLGLTAAAAALLLFMVARPDPQEDPGGLRDPTITATPAPAAIEPLGVVRVRPLTWTRVDGASSYRATLFDPTGTVLFEQQLADTTVALPDSVRLVPQREYIWRVEARTGWDRWSASELFRFRIDSLTASPQAARVSPASSLLLAREPPTSSAELRDSFRAALAAAIRGDSASRAAALQTARRIATAYRTTWRDDFLFRELNRFTAWPPASRASRVWADSVRIAGVSVYGREGPRAAIAVWQRALARARTIPDSAGMAALFGNIGAALAREAMPDSALRYLARAESLAQAAGDLRVLANAVSELAGLSEAHNDIAAARAQYARAIELRGKVGDSRGLAADYNNIASLSSSAGDLDEARRQLEAALAINRRDGRATAAATNLVNLASLAASAGAFARADQDYREALAAWRAGGDSAESASALSGLGELGLRRGDYAAAFEHFSAAALILDRTGPAAEALAVRQRLAASLAAQGRLQEALDELRRGQQAARSLQLTPDIRGSHALARADLAVQLNRHEEAKALYDSAATHFERAGSAEGRAAAQHGLGMLQLAQGNPARAAELLEAALNTQTAARDRRSAAITRLSLADAAAQAGDIAGARRQLERAGAELDRLGDPVATSAALEQRAELEAKAGRLAAAESLYRAALARLGNRAAPEVSWRIHAGLGTVRASLGASEEAAREFRASIADIEGVGSSLRLPERRSGLLSDKWMPYLRLAALELGRGRAATSFAVSEALRAREMTELLSLGRVAAPRDTAAELVAREQDLRRRIAELARAVEGAAPESRQRRGPDVRLAGAVSREALLQAQADYSALRLEIRERAPRHAALIAPAAVSWRSVAEQLGRDEAMLEYLLGESGSYVYVITRDTLVALNLGVSHRELARRVEFARGALQPRSEALDSMWRAPLRQLHRELIAPVEAAGLLAGKTRLLIVPHAELHYLPFAALLERDARFLIQRYQLSVTPSAAVWLALRKSKRASTGSGMLALAPHRDRLPASRREIATLEQVGGAGARVLTDGSASEAAFRREAPSRRLIHLATFGVLNKQNPLFSYIDLAPDGRHDGRLDVHEVFGLSLVADLVVLSACQTALASGALTDVPPGDDWVGLSRAFLTAGAKAVMASLWAVQDQATATLMQRFYERHGEGSDPARTLAAAQRVMLALPATAHPYYWAGFEVVGGR